MARPTSVRILKCFTTDGFKPFASSYGVAAFNAWDFISEAFAEHFDCEPEAVDLVETDEGDFITVHGAIVGSTSTTWRYFPAMEAAHV